MTDSLMNMMNESIRNIHIFMYIRGYNSNFRLEM